MQGVVAVIALAVNVVVLAIIVKRSIEQKKNPYKNEIFTDQRDFQLAMDRHGGGLYPAGPGPGGAGGVRLRL